MQPAPKRSGIGLALGSGAARGLAHIGVLKVLEEANIPINIIAGTSMGAFIGAMYAAGVPVAEMEKVALEIDWRSMARLLDPVIPTSGLTDSNKLVAFMAELLPARDFQHLHHAMAVTATDIDTGETIIIKQGDLLEALRASLAFPGIFSPVRFGERFLVDGGLCKPIPTDVARHLGADKIIGVCTIPKVLKQTPETFLPTSQDSSEPVSRRWRDLFSSPRLIEQALRSAIGQSQDKDATNSRKTPNIFRVCAQSVAIMENVINDLHLHQNPSDLIIRPDLDGVTLLEFHKAKEIIAAGEASATAALPDIEYLLQNT
jgi:NTE family protein